MTILRTICLSAILISTYLIPTQQNLYAKDNLVYLQGVEIPPNSTEQLGGIPGGIISLNSQSLLILDSQRKKLVLMTLPSNEIRDIDLPESPNAPIAIDTDGQSVFIEFINTNKRFYTSIESISQSKNQTWLTKEGAPPTKPYQIWRDDKKIKISPYKNPNVTLNIFPITGGHLVSVNDFIVLKNEKLIASWEELHDIEGYIQTSSWVGIFSSNGELEKLALIPTDKQPNLAHRYVALTSDGKVYFQGVTDGRVFVEQVLLAPPTDSLINSAKQSRQTSNPGLGSEFESAVRRIAEEEIGEQYKVRGTLGKISRTEVIENARNFLTVDWVLKAKNYSRPDLPSICNVRKKQWWLRPKSLEGRKEQSIVAMPYRWGGTSTPNSFTDRLSQGDLAGAVCTCRISDYNYCIVPRTTGVDCSGFISNVWRAERHTTSSLKNISVILPSILDLKPGDALNRPGSHVRLFLGFTNDQEIKIKTIESSVSCGGVCERTYSMAELNGYLPIRFKGITD
ncbi:hypothetical protein [Pseudomonas sp.]|uniref:hypothetical protein n=1 Tax=Pseudomonas sp. TaxID=306 RepID=UPI002486D65B|nr:hypothetical protein [Pseudomonas sp.]MDI1330900.1 hypothetical protein [Pseudomonas sp.]